LPADSRAAFADAIAQNWISAAGLISNGTIWGCLANAVWAVRGATSYEQAVVRAINSGGDTDTVACVAGAIAGAMYTEQGIPSRWLAYVHGTTNGSDVYRLEDLENLARALAGASTPRPSKEPLVTPVEVFPNLYAANRSGAETAPKDWAIISLCRTEGFFVDHEVRRQAYLLDNSHGNPFLDYVVSDTIAMIDALLAEGRKVVVHCEGGRSRTCLALKAWWMTTTGGTHAQAREWLQSSWTMCSDQNPSFIDFLDNFEPQN
jgi:ADP-ribosyl-[dinitrogen reductase] hydrolase